PCPVGAYSTKRTVYQSKSDLRNCTACTCGAVTATCDGSVTLYGGPNCSGPQQSVPSSCTMVPAPVPLFIAMFNPSPPQGASCAATTSPIGNATPTQPTTFCCID